MHIWQRWESHKDTVTNLKICSFCWIVFYSKEEKVRLLVSGDFILMLSHHSCPCWNSAPTCTTLHCHYPCSLLTTEIKHGKDYMSDTKFSDFKQHTTPSYAAQIKAMRRMHWILEVDVLWYCFWNIRSQLSNW